MVIDNFSFKGRPLRIIPGKAAEEINLPACIKWEANDDGGPIYLLAGDVLEVRILRRQPEGDPDLNDRQPRGIVVRGPR
jgi:hypothetical protein